MEQTVNDRPITIQWRLECTDPVKLYFRAERLREFNILYKKTVVHRGHCVMLVQIAVRVAADFNRVSTKEYILGVEVFVKYVQKFHLFKRVENIPSDNDYFAWAEFVGRHNRLLAPARAVFVNKNREILGIEKILKVQ